jgi:DNA polymerase III epsilon subunit-like protein
VNLFYWAGRQQWALAWTRRADGIPTIADVDAAIAAAPELATHQGTMFTDSWHNTAIGQATAWSQPGRAVIVDTETTTLYGRIVQIAVIDAATGDTLLDTLVNPETLIHPEAEAIHGISETDVAHAPRWDRVLPAFEAAVAGRQILAYNAEFDQSVIIGHTRAVGQTPGPWAANARWGCLMVTCSDWEGITRWMKLEGGHDALADCRAARRVLDEMTGLHQVTYPVE